MTEPLKSVPGLRLKVLNDPRVLEKVRVLDSKVYPVKYSDTYYGNITSTAPSHARLHHVALYHDIVVGSITSRLEKTDVEGELKCYIMTVGVLEPYRRLGVAQHLLHAVLDFVATQRDIIFVALHVQIGSPAMQFYQKNGFETKETVEKYYTNIEPTCDAYYLTKAIVHTVAPPAPEKKKHGK
jgi:ribosomal protein S18 acetylase RimI-like enzyme